MSKLAFPDVKIPAADVAVFSDDPQDRRIEKDFVLRLLATSVSRVARSPIQKHRSGRVVQAARKTAALDVTDVETVVDLLDAGAFDRVLRGLSGTVPAASTQRFADVEPLDVLEWAARKGLKNVG